MYSKKCFNQIYRDLYGDAMLVPTWMGTNMADARKPTKTSVTEFWYKGANLFLEELINIKVMLFLIHELFIAKFPEIRHFFNLHTALSVVM